MIFAYMDFCCGCVEKPNFRILTQPMDPEKKSLNFIRQPTQNESTPPAPAVSGGNYMYHRIDDSIEMM